MTHRLGGIQQPNSTNYSISIIAELSQTGDPPYTITSHTWVPSALMASAFTLSVWPLSFITLLQDRGSQTLNTYRIKKTTVENLTTHKLQCIVAEGTTHNNLQEEPCFNRFSDARQAKAPSSKVLYRGIQYGPHGALSIDSLVHRFCPGQKHCLPVLENLQWATGPMNMNLSLRHPDPDKSFQIIIILIA